MVLVRLRTEECVIPDPEKNEDEIRLHCSPNGKDTPQAEEEDAENTFLENISQKLSIKEATGKPLNCSKFALITNNIFIVDVDELKFKILNTKYNVTENCPNMIVPKCNEKFGKAT